MSIKVHKIRVSRARFINYCYVLVDEASREAAIIDPAWQPEEIVGAIESLGCKPRLIALTHAHYDHVNLAPALAARYGVPIFLNDHEFPRFRRRYQTPIRSVREFSAVWTGDSDLFTMQLGQTPFHGFNTPGHTRGSMCFLTSDALITGDTLFIEGCGICEQSDSDPVEMFWSLSLIRRLASDHLAIYPGHCYGAAPGTRFREVLQKNVYLHLNDVEKFVAFRMRANQKEIFNFK